MQIKENFLVSNSFQGIYKNYFLIIFLILLEYLQLYNEALHSINRIANETLELKLITGTNYINPVYFLEKYRTCTIYNEYIICSFPNYFLAVTFSVLIGFQFFFYILMIYQRRKNVFNDLDSKKKGNYFIEKFIKILGRLFAYYFDFIVHILSFSILYILIDVIVHSIYKFKLIAGLDLAKDFIFLSMAVIVLGYFLYFSLYYIRNLTLLLQFNKFLSLQYDNIFSISYDQFLLFYKIMIVLFKSFSIVTEKRFALSLDVFIVFSPLVFILFQLSKIFKGKILFLINLKYNRLRIFLMIFSSVLAIFFLIFYKDLGNVTNLVITLSLCILL